MFDGLSLNDFGVAENEKLFLRHPVTGEEIADKNGEKAYIILRPADSPEGRIAQRKMINKRLTSKSSRKRKADDLEADTAEYLAALIVDWYLVKGDGEPLGVDCNEDSKKKLLTDDSLFWIRDQVNHFAGDLENFLGS